VVDKKLDLQIGPVQLHAAVEMAVNLLSVNIEQKLVTQVGTDLWVEGDPLRVRQVISNLLDNAAKYSEGDSRIEVSPMRQPLHKWGCLKISSTLKQTPTFPWYWCRSMMKERVSTLKISRKYSRNLYARHAL